MLLKGATLVGLDPPRVEPGDLRIEGDRIAERGRDLGGGESLDLSGCLVLPGLVNAHTHLYSALARGMPWPAPPPRNFIEMLEKGGLKVVAARMLRLSRAQAEGFYAVHRERPFFKSLCEFMSSGPILAMVLEGENAIARNREVMGVTDSAKAAEGTIRRRFGTSIEKNAVHGSDAPETARTEIAYFFSPYELNGLGW
jgi:nucleoside-diphosphate kinase